MVYFHGVISTLGFGLNLNGISNGFVIPIINITSTSITNKSPCMYIKLIAISYLKNIGNPHINK